LVRSSPPKLSHQNHPHPRPPKHHHRQPRQRRVRSQDQVQQLPQGENLLRHPRRFPGRRNLQRRRRVLVLPEEDSQFRTQQDLHTILCFRGCQIRNPTPTHPSPCSLETKRRCSGFAGRFQEILVRQHLQILLRVGP